MMDTPEDVQRQYYTRTASSYDKRHVCADDGHYVALKYVLGFANQFGYRSILDVGCGTGRAVKYLMERGIAIKGTEPTWALIEVAIQKNGIPPKSLICGTGESLPFGDDSFDAVLECGVLHHVQKPERVVSEMMRVAKKAVFLSDGNRFGQRSMPLRWIKLLLYKAKVWEVCRLVMTYGRGYTFSEGDGVAYSYSVFDSYNLLSSWADRMILIPIKGEATSWFHPLLNSSQVLLCAIKEE